MIFLVPRSECLHVLLAEMQLHVLLLRSLDMKYFSFTNVSMPVQGFTQISSLPTVCVKTMLSSRPTHPSTLHVKMPNLPKINVCNFRYKITVRILMKLFLLSHSAKNHSLMILDALANNIFLM